MIWAWVCLEVGHEKSTVDDLHLDGHVRGIANLGAHPYCAMRRYESLEGHIFSVNVAMQYDVVQCFATLQNMTMMRVYQYNDLCIITMLSSFWSSLVQRPCYSEL